MVEKLNLKSVQDKSFKRNRSNSWHQPNLIYFIISDCRFDWILANILLISGNTL